MEVLVLILDLQVHVLADRLLDALSGEVRHVQRFNVVFISFKRLLRPLLDPQVPCEDLKLRKFVITSHSPVREEDEPVVRLLCVKVAHSVIVLLRFDLFRLFWLIHVRHWEIVWRLSWPIEQVTLRWLLLLVDTLNVVVDNLLRSE